MHNTDFFFFANNYFCLFFLGPSDSNSVACSMVVGSKRSAECSQRLVLVSHRLRLQRYKEGTFL